MALSKPVLLAGSPMLYDQHFGIRDCTFGEQARTRMDKLRKEQQRDEILQYVCALLNSGGGVIRTRIENKDYNYDTMGLGGDLEEHLTKLVDPSVIEEFIEFIQRDDTLNLYVRSWCPNGQGAKICSVDSGLRERSGTSTPYINRTAVMDFIKKKHNNTFCEPLAKRPKLMQKANLFYDAGEAELEQILDFGESANVEFKSFDRETNLEKRLKENIPKYISAFANTKGGFLFIGVDDKTKRVVGCGQGMDARMIEHMITEICERATARAVHLQDCLNKKDWTMDFKVFKVTDRKNLGPRYIIALKFGAFCCAMFEDDPKCWDVEGDKIVRLNPSSWLEKMQLSDPVHELINRFENVLNLKDSPPQCRPVYSTQNIAKLQERIFSVQEKELNIKYGTIPKEQAETFLLHISHFLPNNGPGILIMSTSWAVDINLAGNQAVLCEALLITKGRYPMFFSWVEKESPELLQYVGKTALNLKQKLVNLGGYTGRLCVIPYLIDCQRGEISGAPSYPERGEISGAPSYPERGEISGAPSYPESYILDHSGEVVALLQSLVIVVLGFPSPLSDTLGCEFFNLLTEEQFNILHGYSGIKRLFIHGPPGSGKTLIAMEKIQRIKNSDGCDNTEILYLCENVGLRDFVRKQSICLCETRASFMKNAEETFTNIKHIIVDEGQNFRLELGNWYMRAESLLQGKHGIFWIFLDYLQRSHTTKDGLPPLGVQNMAFLSEVVRNSKEVFDFMLVLSKAIAKNSRFNEPKHLQIMSESMKLSHSFRGKVVRKTDVLVEREVVKIVNKLLKTGYSARDIAVLYSTAEERDKGSTVLEKEGFPGQFGSLEEVDQDKVVVDTIRRFSGLERNIVIVVDPGVHPFQKEIMLNILLSACSRARIKLFVLSSE